MHHETETLHIPFNKEMIVGQDVINRRGAVLNLERDVKEEPGLLDPRGAIV
jgi:hypothetical protein